MLEGLLRHINNWFERSIWRGEFAVTDGALSLPDLQDGQYFRIRGSVFNDGLHRYPATTLTDEQFRGEVWALAVPQGVIDLAETIEAWCTENAAAIGGPYQSESFGGYSYSRGTDEGGDSTDWRVHFRRELNEWRRI